MSAARCVYVDGIALWAPLLPGWDAARPILRGDSEAAATPAPRPAPMLLPANERRRAPDTVALALEVALRASEAAGADPEQMPSVFASTHGDLAISDYMCATLVDAPTQISPTKFHNSVHNAAAGYWSIATGSHAPYTSVSAYEHTFGEAWLEAASLIECEGGRALLVAYDIEARGPMATLVHCRGMLGVALVLAAERSSASRFEVSWRVDPGRDVHTPARCASLVDGYALSTCLALFEGLASSAPSQVRQTLGADLTLDLALRPLQ
jgi:hypothetical protein